MCIRDSLSVLPQQALEAFSNMTDISTDTTVRVCYASVFFLLSHDSCLDAMIPLCIADKAISFSELGFYQLLSEENIVQFSRELRNSTPEFSDLLNATSRGGSPPNDVLSLLHHCARFVKKIHEGNIIPKSTGVHCVAWQTTIG